MSSISYKQIDRISRLAHDAYRSGNYTSELPETAAHLDERLTDKLIDDLGLDRTADDFDWHEIYNLVTAHKDSTRPPPDLICRR